MTERYSLHKQEAQLPQSAFRRKDIYDFYVGFRGQQFNQLIAIADDVMMSIKFIIEKLDKAGGTSGDNTEVLKRMDTIDLALKNIMDNQQQTVEWLTPLLKKLQDTEDQEMALIDDVTTKVTNLTTVDDSLVALCGVIKAKLDAAGTDPAKLQAISDMLSNETTKISDAVVANTPAETP